MRPVFRLLSLASCAALLGLVSCGGGASNSVGSAPVTPAGSTSIILVDAPADGWSTVEVVVTKVTLRTKADHTKEQVAFSGTSAKINLVDLDSVGELLATAAIPAGTYDAVGITIDPTSVRLVKADGTPVPSSQVHVQGATVMVGLSADLVVTATSSNAVQLDFDLGHPLFLVQLPNGDWSLNLQVKHRPNTNGMLDMAKMTLRHRKGTLSAVGATGFVLHTDAGNDLTVKVSAATAYWNLDTKAAGTLAGLTVGKRAQVAMRMDADGVLWAVRVWYTSAATLPTVTPEGHVTSVDLTNHKLSVSQDTGAPQTFVIDTDTAFTFQDTTTLGTGQALLARVWTGFKVQVEVKDPSATLLHARTVDVQRAVDGGVLKTASATSFTYQHLAPVGDRVHAYAPTFTWWVAGQPGITSSSASAFAAAVAGAGDVRSEASSDLQWNAGTSAWDAANAVFQPVNLPQGTLSTAYAGGQLGFTFQASTGGSQTLVVTLNTTPGLQPAVVEVVRQSGVVTVVPLDVATWAAKLTRNTVARVAVVPKADGTFAATSVAIFTGF